MEPNSLIGRNIGVYKILEKIGQGGMAEVYKGYHPALRRYVAIKLLGRFLQVEPKVSERFQREAQAIASLRHTNIVQVFDFGSYDGGHYMVMEYVEGTDLRAEMDRRQQAGESFTPDEILDILSQVADALDYAHRRGIVHRDVKPGNILLANEGPAILSDFGLAMLRDRISHTSLGHGFGTPAYIAPEQAMDSRAAVPQSDIYALGGVLYELVTGHVPFEAESPISLALKHVSEEPTPPRRYAPHLSRQAEAVILKALAKQPADRFSTASEMVDALRRAGFQDTEQVKTAATVAPTLTSVSYQPPSPPSPPPPPLPVTKVRPALGPEPEPQPETALRGEPVGFPSGLRKRWPYVVGAAAFLLIALVGFLVATRDGGPFSVAAATATPTSTQTATPTRTPTPTSLASPTGGAVIAPTAAATATATSSVTPSPRSTATPVATQTSTETPTSTTAPMATSTTAPMATPTATPLPSPIPALVAGETMTRSIDGMAMHFVPGGPFLMGAGEESDASDREQPQHEVVLGPFWIDETEATNARYRLCVEAGECSEPTNTRNYENPERSDHPVTFVTWEQASAYCEWLANETGWDVHLPTEAQWEKAASWDPASETKRRYPWGEEEPDAALLNYLGTRLGRTAPVGSYPAGASPYGALDMAGNVWEWTADWFDEEYYGTPNPPPDPAGPAEGSEKVMRGGSYGYGSRYVRTTHREFGNPEKAKGAGLGFRCAVTGERLEPEEQRPDE